MAGGRGLPSDLEAILKIPLCTRQVDDFWAWQSYERGIFSIRSSYHMIKRLKMPQEDWIEHQGGASGADWRSKG